MYLGSIFDSFVKVCTSRTAAFNLRRADYVYTVTHE